MNPSPRRGFDAGAVEDTETQEIRRRLVAWDVLAVYQDDDGPDDDREYDDLIGPIATWLTMTLSARIAAFLRRNYGLTDVGDRQTLDLAERLIADRIAEAHPLSSPGCVSRHHNVGCSIAPEMRTSDAVDN